MYESFVALITPFNVNNEIDYLELFHLIDYQIENEIEGIVLLSSVSEAYSLTIEEKIELITKCVNHINGRIKIIVKIVENNPKYILDFSRKIDNLDFDYFMIETPLYSKNNDSGMVKYFTYLADNLSKPIVINDNHLKSHFILSLDVIKRLSYHHNIHGVIESGLTSKELVDYSFCLKENFKVYCADDYLIIPSFSLGYSGIISMVGNAYPKEIVNIVKHLKEDIKVSKNTFNKIRILIEDLKFEQETISLKYLLYILGFNVQKVRLPLDECSNALKRKIEEDCLDL